MITHDLSVAEHAKRVVRIVDGELYEKASKFALFKDTDNKYYTFEEYQTLIKDNQTDKNDRPVEDIKIIRATVIK